MSMEKSRRDDMLVDKYHVNGKSRRDDILVDKYHVNEKIP
jgi:hypothetical protein